MGGIVVRKYIVERAVELVDTEKTIGLFLLASPSLGSSYADWLSPIALLFGHEQADALRFVRNNAWLNDLDKEFINLKEAGKLKLVGKELIEDKFIVLKNFWQRQVVEPFAGARYFGEPYKVPGSDHFSIAKPENNKAIQHRMLCEFIMEHEADMSEKTGEGQSGGVNISGVVGSVGGDIVGGDKTIGVHSAAALDGALRPLIEAVGAAPAEVRAEAEAKLAALKQEAAKGKDANDSVIAKLVDGLVGLVPGATSAVVSAFATPILGTIAGPVTSFVLDKLRGK